VLVTPDMLGLNPGFSPKFLKRYVELAKDVTDATRRFAEDVRGGKYPAREHSFD
jgi:3-methyl-2-oxobutanoate hydroxymethyltransferase